jgi:integrase
MRKCCPENERKKAEYAAWLEKALGKQPVTVDAVLKAIERFEIATSFKPFRKFHRAQVLAFREKLAEEVGPGGQPLSAATITATLKHLRDFFLWLSREPGYRQAVKANDTVYFTPSEQDRRIAGARRERPVPTLEDIRKVLAHMPGETAVEKRNRAVVAFAILSGARDGAIASFRLKHVDLESRTVFHDGRDVKTKGRKTFKSVFFPVGPQLEDIFASYVRMLKDELGFRPEDPLFPSTAVAQNADGEFQPQGLTRDMWATAEPIRRIFRDAFTAAGLPAFNPHSFRRTLALYADTLNLTREEEKAWSQNFGHEHVRTTRESYGALPEHRQAAVMRRLTERGDPKASSDPIAEMRELLDRMAKDKAI